METRNIDFTSLFQEGVSQELKASPMSDLEHLLRQEHSDGQLHSTGRVTLDPSMAVEKFALHTLPRPTAWLVHILRALVEMKTQSLKVFHYEKQLWLWFQATEVWTYENFLENLNAAHPILKSFHLLRSGLLMAALPNNSCFHYTLAGSAEEVFFDGQHLWRRPATTPSTAVKKSGLTTAIEGFHLIRIDTQLSAYDLTVEIRRTGCLAPFAISIHCHPPHQLLQQCSSGYGWSGLSDRLRPHGRACWGPKIADQPGQGSIGY